MSESAASGGPSARGGYSAVRGATPAQSEAASTSSRTGLAGWLAFLRGLAALGFASWTPVGSIGSISARCLVATRPIAAA